MQDLLKLSAQALVDSVYRPMLEAWKDAWGDQVQPYLDLLLNVRNKEIDNKEIKSNTIQFLGFDFEADEFTNEQLTQLIDSLVRFQSVRGSSAFFQIIGWVKNIPFALVPLWTSDYKEFVMESSQTNSQSVANGGDYYPTCHVSLMYDYTTGKITREEVEKLFYEVAPVQLVLHNVVAAINVQSRIPDYVKNSSTNNPFQPSPVSPEQKEEEVAQEEDSKVPPVPNPNDYIGGVNDPEYIAALNEFKQSTHAIFVWQNVPATYYPVYCSTYVAESDYKRGASIIAGSIKYDYSEPNMKFPIDVRYFYNGARKGIAYTRNSRLVRTIPPTMSNSVIEDNEPYYTSKEGYIYSTGANTNLFLNATRPVKQSLRLQPGIYTIWNRGYDGSLWLDFGNDNVVQQTLNSQSTYTLLETTTLVITPETGIVFVQVEPKSMRTQGIYSNEFQPGIKARDHIYTDIDKVMTCMYEFSLIAPDEVTTLDEQYRAVFSYDKFLVECKLGTNPNRQDSMIRIKYGDTVVLEDYLRYYSNNGIAQLNFVLSPIAIIFINKDGEKQSFSTDATRAWFGSNLGKDNADLFIKKILMIQGDLT